MSNGRVALIIAALVLAAATGWGQSKGQSRAGSRAPAKAAVARPKAQVAPKADGATKLGETNPPPASGRGEAKTAVAAPVAGDAGVSVVEKGDGGAKTFRFTETDVEGRLKAPQLVYFLRRVRAEFAAGDLGHRSFMRELSETQREKSF
jgi:hypothetical protein